MSSNSFLPPHRPTARPPPPQTWTFSFFFSLLGVADVPIPAPAPIAPEAPTTPDRIEPSSPKIPSTPGSAVPDVSREDFAYCDMEYGEDVVPMTGSENAVVRVPWCVCVCVCFALCAMCFFFLGFVSGCR